MSNVNVIKDPVALRNTSNVEQYIIHNGTRYFIEPKTIRVFDAPIAALFLDKRGTVVRREEPVVGSVQPSVFEERDWIYNTTGNKDLPETIEIPDPNGKPGRVTIPNPKREGVVIERWLAGGERRISFKGEITSQRMPPNLIRIDPWSRQALPKTTVDWMLRRDAQSDHGLRGAIRRSRAPSEFEPTWKWELDDILLYARMVDGGCKLTPTEGEVRELFDTAETFKDAQKKLNELVGENVATGMADISIENCKTIMLRRLFFRLADPVYPLPTQKEFEEMKASERGEYASDAPATEPPRRGPGRPKKVVTTEVSPSV